LGRTSPAPSREWSAAQSRATEAEASRAEETRARRWARDRGRFTRNFVVQGTAAEWALAWLADLRGRLAALPPVSPEHAAPRSGPALARQPHLAFFLHDEVIVHTPAEHADAAAQAVTDAAASAGRLLFGSFPVDFRLDVHIAETALKD
ncbi:MAG TPA: bifunctional 3'-5' exonuclease/DNA polymerase, partial [Microbacterium sp.]